MPASTSNYNLPYPLESDSDQPYSDIQALAQAVDDQFTEVNTAQAPMWDSSNSVALNSNVNLVQSTRTTIITQTFLLTRDQNVLIGGKILLRSQSLSIGPGLVGVTLVIDGVDFDQTGPIQVGAYSGPTDHGQITLTPLPYPLTAGTHSVSLVADRDINGLVNAVGTNTELAVNYQSTRLTIIV